MILWMLSSVHGFTLCASHKSKWWVESISTLTPHEILSIGVNICNFNCCFKIASKWYTENWKAGLGIPNGKKQTPDDCNI